MKKLIAVLITLSLIAGGCPRQSEESPATAKEIGATRVADSSSWLSRYDLRDDAAVVMKIPRGVREASGLAMTGDGRLFVHDDEDGTVYEVDPRSGKEVKRFSLGRITVSADFEGIATNDSLIFLVSSGGEIFEFREGKDKQHVQYRVHSTPLTGRYDVEGLEYDPLTNSLLLCCKGFPGKKYSGSKAVYSFSLDSFNMNPEPALLIPLNMVSGGARNGEFNPSGIALHPAGGTFFILTADGSSLIEVTRKGVVIAQKPLSRKIHPQPEGIVFGHDNSLYICNDGQGGDGNLVRYSPQVTR